MSHNTTLQMGVLASFLKYYLAMRTFLISTIWLIVFLTALPLKAQPWKEHGPLGVNQQNPHYIQFSDGTPFFWLGDTGWEMLHRLNRDEISHYLHTRREQGFNVIQTVVVSEFIHMDKVTNFYGDSIFVAENPEQPAITSGTDPSDTLQYDFWDHVDYAVSLAAKEGLYMGLLPTWGEWVIPRTDKALFNTKNEAYNYGWFIGNRYKSAPNIIWILGGDREPEERKDGVEIWRTMAEGITDGVNGEKNMDGKANYATTFMTNHCYNSSSNWFHNDPWIDLHTWGSYHAEIDNQRSIDLARKDWNLPNPKPTLNSEPCYEGAPINYGLANNGFFTATDTRVAAYWSVFSGCAGFTYGADLIWQFVKSPGKEQALKATDSWQEELNFPGAVQMVFLKKLMESRPMQNLIPDQSMIADDMESCSKYACAIRGKSHAFIYIPQGSNVALRLGVISGKTVRASWFNPRTGKSILIGSVENKGVKSFEVPPSSKDKSWLRTGRGCDWVLLLDDETAKYPLFDKE